jgi:hypothetical protein
MIKEIAAEIKLPGVRIVGNEIRYTPECPLDLDPEQQYFFLTEGRASNNTHAGFVDESIKYKRSIWIPSMFEERTFHEMVANPINLLRSEELVHVLAKLKSFKNHSQIEYILPHIIRWIEKKKDHNSPEFRLFYMRVDALLNERGFQYDISRLVKNIRTAEEISK